MAESEEDNLNILTSWAPKAYQCFAAEFDELEQLKRQYEETASGTQHELEAQCRAEVDMQIQREYPDVYPLLSGISSTPWPVTATPTSPPLAPTSSAGGSSVKRQKGKQVQQQLQAEVAMVTARREALLHQHIQSAIVAQDRQPARQLAARYSSELATTQKHVKAFLEKEAHELQRFTSRPLASYALGEVLDAPPVPPKAVVAPTASAAVLATSSSLSNAKRSRAASISRAASERGSARSSRTKNSAARPAARSGKGGRAGTRSRTHSMAERKQEAAVETDEKGEQDTTTAAEIPAFLIDAHQFAVDYNEMLKKEYGYRPAMTNTFPCAADANKPTAASNDGKGNAHEAAGAAASASPVIGATKPSQQEKLRTHVPGKTTKRAVQSGAAAGEDDNGSWWLPPIHAASQQGFTADSAALRSARDAPAPKMKDVEAVEETNQRFAHSSPTLRRPEKPTGTTGSHNHHLRHDNHRTQRTDGAGAATKTPAAKMGTKGGGFASPVASLLDGIDCVAKEKGLRFSSYAGVLTRQVVRFVNRNAHRTRLRLKASAHPWFSYRCTRIAPAAGSVATTTADAVPPETPLNCGGFVEVEVIFCPQSIEASTAVVESVLEMGVAREINDRLSEGAQWQFLNISVHGQVVLPHFDWWRRSSTGGEKENALGSDSTANVLALSEEGAQNGAPGDSFESGTIVSHDHLLSCATPLYLGNGAAVEFGDVLVLSRTQQTLLLENTGSEAVVHLLSSSPEFAVSMAPEVATTLPSSLAVALQVTFCPLKEGLCEATLTVAVRASSDPASAVISESTVELHGIGVVPRVSITSLASQVVQERVLPQWQVNRTEAPLHTILRDTVPGVPSEVTVTVCNECAVPLAFHWEGDSDVPHSEDSSEEPTEAVKADSPVPAAVAAASTASTNVTTLAARSFMSPPCGTLAPFSTSTFVLTVTPATLQPLQTLYNLFLDDMPDPAAAESTEKLPFVDAEVVEFYRRSRLIPCTAQQQQDKAPSSIFDHNANLEDDPAHFDAQQVTYLDPVTAFSRFQRSAAENAGGVAARTPRGVFATSFLTYQQPSLPSLTITPAVIEERVECLLTCRHTRTVTMHNNAPVALHFILDPTEAEFTTSLQQPSFLSNLYGSCGAAPLLAPTATTFERWRGCFPASDGISAQCQPRKGTIPPHGSINITVHFTVEACGPHYAVVPCWVPAAEQLRAVLATAGPAVRTASASCRPSLPTHPGSGSKGQHPQPGPAGPPPTGRGRPISPVALQLTPEDASLGNYRLSERRQPSRLGSGSVGHTVTTVSRSPAEEALRVIEDGGCYAVSVTATGVGATVKASTDLLDFGLIELGQEAAASFTVSNPNSIPVVFDLCDPLMRHPPRFVFIPESFRLGAGNTVEVTVYRKAVSTEDAQTFFELTVRDGGASIAVETRATVQQPLLVVDAPVVQFGVVPENVWQTGTFHVSNRSAIDTEFTVTPATPLPPYIEVEYEKDVVLRAGEQLDVPVRCRFQAVRASLPPTSSTRRVSRDKKVDGDGAFASPHEALPSKHKQAADNCYSILLRLVSKRSRQTLLVEVRCDAVEKLSVSVDVATDGVQDGEAALPSTSAAAYIRAVLMNGLEAALLALDQNEAQATHADIAAVATAPPPATAAAIPYCDPVHLVDYMPDDLPLSRRTVHLVLQSYTGGEAAFTVAAQRYAPQSIENIGAQHILDKRASVNAAAAATTSKKDAKEAKGDDDDADNAFAAADCTSAFAEDETAVSPPAFWTTTVNGSATVQQAQRQIMEATQKVLGDGAGCVTLLSSAAGVLRSHGVVHIPVHLWCALPGRYVEHLCVQADPTLPLLRIPVEYEVYGKPIVLDATTSGLTKEGGRGGEDVLLMPPVIAPLGSSRRTIRLINRVSRDMDVTVEIFPCPLGMSVHAVDPDAPADKVELKLVTMTAEDKDREKSRIGQVTATPFKLCIPAHARREVVLEFTPAAVLTEGEATNDGAAASKRDARIKKTIPAAGHRRSDGRNESDSGSDEEAMLLPEEKWWHGSVCIDAVLAHTDSNDVFLVDEFYTIYADRYPSRRVARPMTSAPAGSGNSNSSGFAATQVRVLRPLRSRPNDRVVRRGRIVWPTEAEQRVLDRFAATAATSMQLAEGSAKATGATAGGGATASSDDDNDDAHGNPLIDASSFPQSSPAHKGSDNAIVVVPSLDVLLREAEERQALLDFICARRRALQEEGSKYFPSIELRLRARCGRPHLTVEPSEKCVEFPAVPRTEEKSASKLRCTRTARLTNRNSAPLRFALSLVSPSDEANAMASPSAELFSIVRCALWKSGRDEARELFSLSSSAAQDGAAGAERRFNPDETHVYTLDSMDALDVTIDAQTHSAAWHHHLSQQHHCTPATKETVEGMLKVQFLLTSTVSSMTNTQKTPAQLLPLRIPLIKPNIECRPGVIWFRPGQQRHDGRAQVAYTQTFTVYNTSAAAARFRIYPVPGSTADIRKKAAMDTFRAQQQLQLQRSVLAASVAASPAVASELVTANTMTTTVGVVGDDVHHSLMHKVKEVVKMPATAPPAEGRADLVYVDDPAQFTISPSEGVVPAASLGGEPAEVKIRVDFREFSSIRYESLFAVAIEGDPSVPPTYVVVRGDSRDTEV